jgi:hypothetical protein
MAYYGASDIDGMLAEFGAPIAIVVAGERHEGIGIVDTADSELLRDLPQATVLVGKIISVLVKTDALPGIAEGASLEVDGAARRIISVQQIDDGALTRVLVART